MNDRPCHSGASGRRVEITALVGSVVLLVVGLWRLEEPSAYPSGPTDRYHDLSLMANVTARQAAMVAMASGAVATVTAVLACLPNSSAVVRTVPLLVAVPMAVTYGFLVPDIQMLILVA